MTLFAIKHKNHDTFMPLAKYNRGYTHLEVTEFKFLGVGLPRLFKTEIGAKRAILAWSKGAWKTYRSGSTGLFGDDFEIYSEPPIEPSSNRKVEDLEVVRMVLTENVFG